MITKSPAKTGVAQTNTRIYLIDDHSILRDGLRRLLESEGNFTVCGEAGNAKTAIPEIVRLAPHLVIVDISLPGIDGIELIKALRVQSPRIRMLVLSMHDQSLFAERALRAGALGYVMKQSSPKHLLTAIHTVLKDQVYLHPAISSRMIHSMVNKGPTHRSDLEMLSDRELRILQLIGDGFTASEIAVKLGISRKTVESHRGNARHKLGLRTGAELTRFALSQRLNT